MIVSFARCLGGKPSSVKMAFYGGLTPKHLDVVAFTMCELFYINKLSKHVSMLIWLSAQQKWPPLGYPRQTGVLVHLPIPPQSADSGGC